MACGDCAQRKGHEVKITDLAALTMWLAVLGVAVLAASWIVSQAAGKVRRAV